MILQPLSNRSAAYEANQLASLIYNGNENLNVEKDTKLKKLLRSDSIYAEVKKSWKLALNTEIELLDYGTGPLNSSAGTVSADMLTRFPNSITNIEYSGNELADTLQKSINSGRERFQLKVYWSHPHNNNDDTEDSMIYLKQNIYLTIRYTE